MNGDTTQGILSQLLGGFDPAARQQAMQQRQQAQQQYQGVLEEPLPDAGPVQRMVGDYLMRYGESPNMDFSAVAGAIGGEVARTRQQQVDDLKRREFAAANKAKIAGEEVGLQDAAAKNAIMALRAARPGGGAGGANVKMDRDGNMVVYDPVAGEARVVHSSQRNEYQRVWQTAYREATEQGMDDPENYAHLVASRVLGQSPGFNPRMQGVPASSNQAPGGVVPPASAEPEAGAIPTFSIPMNKLPPEAVPEMDALVAGYSKGNRKEIEQKMAELAARYGMVTGQGGQPPAPAAVIPPAANIQYRDKPRAKMQESAAEGVGKAAGDEYTSVVVDQAKAAQGAFDAFRQLEDVAPQTGRFANIFQYAGDALAAMGQDPNTPLIQNAIKNREAETILNQLRNASLKAEKGVQTASDEKRIAAELPNVTDQAAVWKFSTKLGKERAQRQLDKANFYRQRGESQGGRVVGIGNEWDAAYRNDPLTQYLGGKLVFRSDFIRAFQQKYPDATPDEAVAEWRDMEQDYLKRGGRK